MKTKTTVGNSFAVTAAVILIILFGASVNSRAQSFSISGVVKDNFSNPMNNVVVTLSGGQSATVTTGADGSFSFSSVAAGGNYTVTPSFPKFVFSPPNAAFTNLSNNRGSNFTGSVATFTISGAVNDTSNGSGIDFLPVILTGTRTGSVLTNSQGYSFSNLPIDGNYTVTAFNASGNLPFTNIVMLPPATRNINGLSANTTANFSARRLNFSTGDSDALGIARGDLNGDGKLDVAVATTTGSNIHVLMGNGDGTLNTQVTYPASANPTAVVMADFNQDGKLDVASAGGAVSVFVGNGDGTLKARVNYPIAISGNGYVMCAADFNLDNKIDLAVLSAGNFLNVLLGNGDGTFAPAVSKNIPTAVASIVSRDFNSDGKPDLIFLGFPDSLLLLTGNGDGTFANPVKFVVGGEVRKAAVADFNGDGKLDVAVAGNRRFTILSGNGNGNFQVGSANTLSQDTVEIISEDFDGDNKLDLAIGNGSGGPFYFAPGNGDGTFGPAVFAGGGGAFGGGMVAGDFNTDGKLDVAYASGSGVVSMMLNTLLTRLPWIQFSVSSLTVDEAAGNALLTVTRTAGVPGPAKVSFATSDTAGTQSCSTVNARASSRCDYSAVQGTLEFAAGESSKTIAIPISDDSYAEGNESFTLSLLNPVGASLGATIQVTINISDNDSANAPNPINLPPFLVSQHYRDFLNRQPDPAGLAFWTDQITSCGGDAGCIEVRQINVSASFFLSIEYQETGYLVERFYKTAYGDATGNSTLGSTHQLAVPIVRFSEFLPDALQIGKDVIVGQAGWEQKLGENKVAFALDFVSRAKFYTTYPTTLTPEQFVDLLCVRAGLTITASERASLVNEFAGAGATDDASARARVLRQLAEHPILKQGEFNRAFVLMQYFGYLRRNPNDAPDSDYTGYDFWLTKLNQFNGNYINAEMVKAFLSSIEYRQRFGP